MATSNSRTARINSQRFSYQQTFGNFKTNLFNCNGIEQREYINQKGEHKIFVKFNFANGSKSLSIDPTDEVETLLVDFMNNTGEFSLKREDATNLRNEQ